VSDKSNLLNCDPTFICQFKGQTYQAEPEASITPGLRPPSSPQRPTGAPDSARNGSADAHKRRANKEKQFQRPIE
jgi:hypothetical protein